MSDDIKSKLRAALEKMTPGPWYANVTRPGAGAAVCHREAVLSEAMYPPVMVARHPGPEGPRKTTENVANLDGIVALRNHALALLSSLEELELEVAALRAAMCDAMTDIQQWMQLARRQREEIPNVNHCPYGPNEAGIEASERVLGKCRAALSGRPPSE